MGARIGGVGFVTVDFAGGGAGHNSGGSAVDDHPEAVVLADHGGGLARVMTQRAAARLQEIAEGL
jgi:hypothetical protein